jgi:carbohydrate kinase (thermoresistant glucokinase family)
VTPPPCHVLVLMGVSGTGKTTIAQELRRCLAWPFQEGDDLHAPDAVAKMRAGTPLSDADRLPWLGRVAAVIDGWLAAGSHGLITCSALKRAYRDVIIGPRAQAGVRLVYLHGSPELLRRHLNGRRGHYMPASLLDSQLATLEPPAADESPISIDVGQPLNQAVQNIIREANAQPEAG